MYQIARFKSLNFWTLLEEFSYMRIFFDHFMSCKAQNFARTGPGPLSSVVFNYLLLIHCSAGHDDMIRYYSMIPCIIFTRWAQEKNSYRWSYAISVIKYITGTCLSSILGVEPSKTRPKLQAKQGSPFGFQVYLHIFHPKYNPIYFGPLKKMVYIKTSRFLPVLQFLQGFQRRKR